MWTLPLKQGEHQAENMFRSAVYQRSSAPRPEATSTRADYSAKWITSELPTSPLHGYFASAGSVVYTCAADAGIRIPKAPICAPDGLSNSMVPRMAAAAGYLSDPRVNA